HRWLNHSIETAQRRVEERNFSIRKRTLEYDDVMNRQRAIVYEFRSDVLKKENAHELALDILHDVVLTQAETYLTGNEKDCQPEDFAEWIQSIFPVLVTPEELKAYAGRPADAAEEIYKRVEEAYELKCSLENQEVLPRLERFVLLRAIDREWQDYLRAMDDLRDAVRLRAYGQRDPLIEFKREAYSLFEHLMLSIKTRISSGLFRASTSVENMQNFMAQIRRPRRIQLTSPSSDGNGQIAPAPHPAAETPRPATAPASQKTDAAFDSLLNRVAANTASRPAAISNATGVHKVGRNDPCPCGSGKKYKNCHGKK
ncbi:MAG: SEC-C metal-binding domain-containing protein, partial [Kiritimatiellia bacterium]